MSACKSMIWSSFLRTISPVLSASRRTSSGTLMRWLPRPFADRPGLAARSGQEPGVFADGLHTLVHREGVEYPDPFFARMTHGVEGELPAAEVLHAGELRLEGGRDGVGTWAGIGRGEVEVVPEP